MIHLSSLLAPELIRVNHSATSKEELLSFISELLHSSGFIEDKDKAFNDLLRREKIQSTGIGNGVAIPHLLSPLKSPVLGIIILKKPIDFNSIDSKPVDVVFFSAASESKTHLKMLARLARMLKETELIEKLRKVRDEKEVLRVFKQEELSL